MGHKFLFLIYNVYNIRCIHTSYLDFPHKLDHFLHGKGYVRFLEKTAILSDFRVMSLKFE